MPAIFPAWTEPDPALHARLGDAVDPERKVLGALEKIVSLSGKRIADVGTGLALYPVLLARRTGRIYGIESDPALLAEARRRAARAHQPNIRIVAGDATNLPLRDGTVDVVLSSSITPDDGSLPAIAEADRVLRPGGILIVVGYYGRDDVAGLVEPEVVAQSVSATHRRSGWWQRHGFKIKVVHARVELGDPDLAHDVLPRLFGDRGRAYLMAPHAASLSLNLGLYHRATSTGDSRSIGGQPEG